MGTPVAMTVRLRAAEALASVGGLGRAPVAPGTVGSLAGILVALALPGSPVIQAAVITVLAFAGVWAGGLIAVSSGDHDPSRVVIDEVAGMLIACFLLPRTWLALCSAFMLFRILDIWKWFPMRQLERLPGGWGIMMDDLAAGLITRMLLLWL